MTMAEKPADPSYFADMAAKKAVAKRSTVVDKACQWVVENQISWSAGLLAVIHGYDYLIADGNSKLVHLQHRIPDDALGRYARGRLDAYYILHWAIAFTLIRATIMYKMLEPFAKWYGVKSLRKVTRFGEQGWLTIYYIISNAAGLYVMYQGPHWMDTRQFWMNYPEGHKQMSALM
ncbi:Sphingosine N-acyltransferase lag1, partial [Coemansia aciculifera]